MFSTMRQFFILVNWTFYKFRQVLGVFVFLNDSLLEVWDCLVTHLSVFSIVVVEILPLVVQKLCQPSLPFTAADNTAVLMPPK
jgi:hypothetical protein